MKAKGVLKLTKKLKPVKLGCGITVKACIKYGMLSVFIPNYLQTMKTFDNNHGGEDAVLIVSPSSISGLEKILSAFKSSQEG